MSILCDRLLGYTLDISNEIDLIDCSLRESLYDLKDDNKYGIKSYWNNNLSEGDIVILHDGLNGEFTKLVYIIAIDSFSNVEESKDFCNSLNKLLSTIEVPNDVRLKFIKIYKEIFNKVTSAKNMKVEYFLYWY